MNKEFNLRTLTIIELKELIKKGQDPKEIFSEMRKLNKNFQDLNIFIDEFFDEAIEKVNENSFIPIAIKDCFHMKGKITTSGSKMLKNLKSPFDATVVKRLENKECISVGKTSLDEFAMGSSGKSCAYGLTKSPWRNLKGEEMSPGGSSSGSAAAVALGCALGALGTDTAGSVRQPSAWCGLVGLKPTYGVLSRYGMIELASSLDCPGIMTKTVEDNEYLFNKVIGADPNEYNSCDYIPQKSTKKIGFFKHKKAHKEILEKIDECKELFESLGYELIPVDIELIEYTLPVYYLICSSEASSNLSRFNGLLYGDKDVKFEDPFLEARTKLFGDEVKRRIVAGNYSMYFGNKEDYYKKGRQILQIIYKDLSKILKTVDAILMPTVGGPGMTVEESLDPDPVKMYLCDLYTSLANLLGLPAMNVPVGLFKETGTPMGLQILSKHFGENLIFEIGKKIDKYYNFNLKYNWRNNGK